MFRLVTMLNGFHQHHAPPKHEAHKLRSFGPQRLTMVKKKAGCDPPSQTEASGCLGFAFAVQQRIQQDRTKGGGTDACHRKVAKVQCEVASAQDQGNGRHNQVLVLRKIDLVIDPYFRRTRT